MKYFWKMILITILCMAMSAVVILTSGNLRLSFGSGLHTQVVREKAKDGAIPQGYQEEKPVLILYSPEDEVSVKYKENLEDTLSYLKWEKESLEVSRADSVSYQNYGMVILASQRLEYEMSEGLGRLFHYVEEGGLLFWGLLQYETSTQFQKVYKSMGIIDYGDYVNYESCSFDMELLPGMKGEVFSGEAFSDAGLFVRVDDKAKVYAHTEVNGQEVPIIWTYDWGKGRVSCYNGTCITGDFYKGLSAGCLFALKDTVMYPIVNAKCIFIDDFPSPQYDSDSDVIRQEYNRSVREFYRDIWWPDMQKLANRLDYVYTGLFVTTYNNIVDPDSFTLEAGSTEQYFGNSLLRAGHEMGAHGYNHQSLAKKGDTPKEMGYKGWKDQEDMEKSLKTLLEIAQDLFPGITLKTYVPPSNYLSLEGRRAAKEALPDLEVVSGVYTNEGEEGAVYCQRFEVAWDGIGEFPRVTAGMIPSDYDRLSWLSALGLHGVFSHFIHPDDILDKERGKDQTWEFLRDNFAQLLMDVNQAAPGLRSLWAFETADALKTYQETIPFLLYKDDQVQGSLKNFSGEAYFYLKTEKKPVSKDNACAITALNKKKGDVFYLVQVKAPEFTILLEEE